MSAGIFLRFPHLKSNFTLINYSSETSIDVTVS